MVLVAPRNPLNIGAAARAMSNFGFQRLRLVNPYSVAFREARSAVGAASILQDAEEYPTLAEAVADCALVAGTTSLGKRGLKHPLYRLEHGARQLRRGPAPAALLFGSEKYGLSNDDLSHCHILLRIAAREEHASMNLGQAVAVCLWELVRTSGATAARRAPPRASAAQLELFTTLLLDALARSGYVHSPSVEQKVRRLIRRLDLPPHDAEVWQGMLRQILWKLARS